MQTQYSKKSKKDNKNLLSFTTDDDYLNNSNVLNQTGILKRE